MRTDTALRTLTTRSRDTHANLASILQRLQALEASLLATPGTDATVKAAKRLNRAAGTLALSVLLDSALEHYRGSFKNPAMFTFKS